MLSLFYSVLGAVVDISILLFCCRSIPIKTRRLRFSLLLSLRGVSFLQLVVVQLQLRGEVVFDWLIWVKKALSAQADARIPFLIACLVVSFVLFLYFLAIVNVVCIQVVYKSISKYSQKGRLCNLLYAFY